MEFREKVLDRGNNGGEGSENRSDGCFGEEHGGYSTVKERYMRLKKIEGIISCRVTLLKKKVKNTCCEIYTMYNFLNNFMYFWLCWVFLAMQAFL